MILSYISTKIMARLEEERRLIEERDIDYDTESDSDTEIVIDDIDQHITNTMLSIQDYIKEHYLPLLDLPGAYEKLREVMLI
jgi:hypothetical protein